MGGPLLAAAKRVAPLLAAVLAAAPAADRSAAAADGRAPGFNFRVIQRAAGLSSPIGVANPGDGTGRLFIVEQSGVIKIWDGAQVLSTPFLDINLLVLSGGERGLLGLAFHPSYETNGYFYVNYTCDSAAPGCSGGGFGAGDSVLARYQVSANPNQADPASERVLTVIDDPASNHNGGNLAFGPDGYLYWGLGDGGGGGDPCEHAQNLLWEFPSTGACIPTTRANRRAFWGKMLRLDVNQNVNTPPFYGIPPTNPWTGTNDPGDTIPDEVWAYGLRNPWRFSFDRGTGDLYVADVGQGAWEEFTFLAAPLPAGLNFGWDVLEGGTRGPQQVPTGNCFENVPSGSCNAFINGGSLLPALDYPRSEGSTIIGGFVYRGRPASNLFGGQYIFGDLGSSHFWRAQRVSGVWQKTLLFDYTGGVTAFGEDERGKLFFVALDGTLNQVVPFSFLDVDPSHFAWSHVEALYEASVTGGCGGDNYCPDAITSRGEMAVFLLRARFGAAYTPPACTNAVFTDVPCSHAFARWIYDLVSRGVTAGCGNGQYCPASPVTRDQMAVFLLRTLEGPGYAPPPCSVPTFGDVPCSNIYAAWIEELVRRNVTGGCGGGNYCPTAAVSRAQMAVFLVATFGLVPV